MGPVDSSKSKLAIDLASHFPVEIINTDSTHVYQDLDVLTNKVPLQDQKGVPHQPLGTLINEILSRNHMPIILGGTNYYIQALVSPFLLDDSAEDMEESCFGSHSGHELADLDPDIVRDKSKYSYDLLKDPDLVAVNRIHPNNQRKITQYLSLYACTGILPSKLERELNGLRNVKKNTLIVCIT